MAARLKLSLYFCLCRNVPTEILEAHITGIPEAIGNLTERGAVDPVVKVTVVLSESGFAGVQDAIAYGEVKDTSFTGESLNPDTLFAPLLTV